jgi:signal transduction histidine kinase
LYWQAQRREEQLHRMISHEVRGGLAAIITGLEDLQDAAAPALGTASAEQLASITRRCWSLSQLLGDLLAPAGRQGPTWVETAPIFETLAARFGMYADGRAIELTLPARPPRVWADPLQLREAFANLVANAVRYLDKEPGRVTVTCEEDGDFCRFGVADNGPGIPEEVREHIFEPFVRGTSAQGRHPGTGLGLYFVRTIVEQGGGKIWVESTPGQGSCFWFTVPRVPPRESAPPLVREGGAVGE